MRLRLSISKAGERVDWLQARLAAEKKAARLLLRELRVLRKVRFSPELQTPSVRVSLELIKHTSP